MTDTITNSTSHTSDEDGKSNHDVLEGAADSDALTPAEATEPRLFDQKAVNDIVRRKQAEWRKNLEKSNLILSAEELQAKIDEAVNAHSTVLMMQAARNRVQQELGLTDAQTGRLTGDDEAALRQDALLLFGGKLAPPKLPLGTPPSPLPAAQTLDAQIGASLQRVLERKK